MAGKVLRCAGAALLAGFFIAATVARGQTPPASDQNVDAFPFTCTAALIPVVDLGATEFARPQSKSGCELWAENPRAEALYPSVTFHGPEGSRFHQTPISPTPAFSNPGYDQFLLPPTPRFQLSFASLPTDSDSGDGELPSAPAPAIPASRSAPYTPITGRERVMWVVKSTLWPQHLVAGVITMGIATAEDAPPEDGPHWGGFGERYGIRLTGVATSDTMEAGLGALWGEDPRYFRVAEESFGGRVKNVIKMTFLARRRDGDLAPAYARFIAVPGSNFLSNAWRPDSAADPGDAVRRTFEGFAGHMAGNAFNEFWPDAKQYIFHHGKQQQ